jgi:hypothetical protein
MAQIDDYFQFFGHSLFLLRTFWQFLSMFHEMIKFFLLFVKFLEECLNKWKSIRKFKKIRGRRVVITSLSRCPHQLGDPGA